jgi:hypothetical protein
MNESGYVDMFLPEWWASMGNAAGLGVNVEAGYVLERIESCLQKH